jgi:putative pyruvate formate lyase activating enzyme
MCRADRASGAVGICGGGADVRVALAAPHYWEEPCISGTSGTGAVFFSGCHLRCPWCQNYDISAGNFGAAITTARLAEIFSEFESSAVHNISLVTPTHYLPWILEARAVSATRKPLVYNTGGYERTATLKTCEGVVAVYLPDLKYREPPSYAPPDYFEVAVAAIDEMVRQVGPAIFGDDGTLTRGVLVRHLVLPGRRHDAIAVMRTIAERYGGDVLVSVMRQFTPRDGLRRVCTFEYDSVAEEAYRLGLQGYLQGKESAQNTYTPNFDLRGCEDARTRGREDAVALKSSANFTYKEKSFWCNNYY